MFFSCLSVAILLFILKAVCWDQSQRRTSPNGPGPNNRPGPSYRGGGYGGDDSPPPYSDHDFKRGSSQPSQSSNSDFARGAAVGALGGAAALAAAQAVRSQWSTPEYRAYDWEGRDRSSTTSSTTRRSQNSDRGEGSSNLGSLRASTGFASSSVR